MSYLLYLFGSGLAFFVGAGLVLGGFSLRVLGRRKWVDRAGVYAVDIGLIVVALSAAPLPYWLYALAALATVLWLVKEKSPQPQWQNSARKRWLRLSVVAVWQYLAVCEAPYHVSPVSIADRGEIYVIGDSITAGLGDKIVPWPELLAGRRGWQVESFARAAATTSQALQQAKRLPDSAEIVIVEIGGNDLLSDRGAAEFGDHLEALLSEVRGRSDQVLMFELPLPPLCNEFGRIQRRLAARHGVKLIPKRCLMGVLASQASTSDSVHLTAPGQQQLADLVSDMVRSK